MGIISQRLRDSARGQVCTVGIPGVCNHNPETTVLAHLPSAVKGMGTKSDDWHACYACSDCHAYLDNNRLTADEKLHYMFRALQRTQRAMFEQGLLSIPTTTTRRKQSSKILPRPAAFRR